MSGKRVVLSAFVIGWSALLAAPAQATEPYVDLTPKEIQKCIKGLGSKNPDVIQGWIDNCRRDKTERVLAPLYNHT